jgi:hypothetical protein
MCHDLPLDFWLGWQQIGQCGRWRFAEKVHGSAFGNVRFLKFRMCTAETKRKFMVTN